jgi:predicted nuclease of restriction endonuclease-like (RecB) superfamily
VSKAGSLVPADYAALLTEVKERVRAAQYKALRAVNKELIGLYWDIGRIICDRQAGGASWGKSVVERLAADLRAEFPGVQGFSAQNLWYMRQFHRAYHGHEKLQPLVGEISWSKHLVILGKRDDPLEREFYIRSTKKFGWTKNVLIHQIENQSYIELKIGKFEPEFAGKMQFYLTALDRQVREVDENPSIGIILCKEKNRTVVEYALHDSSKPIGVATYRTVKRLPKELKGQLPAPEEIAKLLAEEE